MILSLIIAATLALVGVYWMLGALGYVEVDSKRAALVGAVFCFIVATLVLVM